MDAARHLSPGTKLRCRPATAPTGQGVWLLRGPSGRRPSPDRSCSGLGAGVRVIGQEVLGLRLGGRLYGPCSRLVGGSPPPLLGSLRAQGPSPPPCPLGSSAPHRTPSGSGRLSQHTEARRLFTEAVFKVGDEDTAAPGSAGTMDVAPPRGCLTPVGPSRPARPHHPRRLLTALLSPLWNPLPSPGDPQGAGRRTEPLCPSLSADRSTGPGAPACPGHCPCGPFGGPSCPAAALLRAVVIDGVPCRTSGLPVCPAPPLFSPALGTSAAGLCLAPPHCPQTSLDPGPWACPAPPGPAPARVLGAEVTLASCCWPCLALAAPPRDAVWGRSTGVASPLCAGLVYSRTWLCLLGEVSLVLFFFISLWREVVEDFEPYQKDGQAFPGDAGPQRAVDCSRGKLGLCAASSSGAQQGRSSSH